MLNVNARNPRKRRRAAPQRLQQTASELHRLQEEVQALKLQIARMEAALETRQATQSSRYHVPQSLDELKPRREPPPGKTAMEMIQGQWPGEETTEELLAQLKALG